MSVEDLAPVLKEKRAILFVGAGVSHSLGLPSWRELIKHMGADVGFDGELFANSGHSFWTLAEYYYLEKHSLGPLKGWMNKEWHVSDAVLATSKTHNLIIDLDFPLIYTTNYDQNLERAHRLRSKQYKKIASVRDLAGSIDDGTKIIKFHGDLDDENSLVVTESDYFDRLSFESPLDINFRSEVLGKTVLFIGYSLSDLNLRLLLYKLHQTWKQSGYESERPKFYIFMNRPDIIQEKILRNWGIIPINEDTDDPYEGLPVFLEKLKAAMS